MKLKTLIVDDDPIMAFMHEALVEESQLSPQPATASNGKEALDLIHANIDCDTSYLVLLDINMPVMNGWQFLEALPEIPFSNQIFVILVTSSVDRSDHERAKNYEHVIDFIEKPFSLETCERIKNIPVLSCLLTS